MKISHQRINFLKTKSDFRKRMKICKEFTKSFFGMVNVITNEYKRVNQIETL